MPDYLPIFVYGTLKQGEERSGRWPHAPLRIEPAVVAAQLYDLGPYPALAPGNDRVLGELWTVAPDHFERTLAVLDEIECFGVDDVDLYVRRMIPCLTDDGREQQAYAYFIADPQTLQRARRVSPDERGLCHWSAVR